MSESPDTTTTTTPDPATAPAGTPTGTPSSTTTDAPFYAAFADELKNAPAVTKYKTVEDLARGLVAAENRLGTPADQLVRKPKGLDDAEGVAAYLKVLGVPDTPDGYNIELVDTAPGAKELADAFAAKMHAAHAPPALVKAALDFWNDQTAAAATAAETERAAALTSAETALKQEWGAAYEAKLGEIGRLLQAEGGDELQKELVQSGMGNNVLLLKTLGKVLDRMAEPGQLTGNNNPATPGALTPGQAKAARQALEADPIKNAALFDRSHSLHASVVAERNRYFQLERGETPAA